MEPGAAVWHFSKLYQCVYPSSEVVIQKVKKQNLAGSCFHSVCNAVGIRGKFLIPLIDSKVGWICFSLSDEVLYPLCPALQQPGLSLHYRHSHSHASLRVPEDLTLSKTAFDSKYQVEKGLLSLKEPQHYNMANHRHEVGSSSQYSRSRSTPPIKESVTGCRNSLKVQFKS